MNSTRKIVFLTGGTGNMGAESIKRILALPNAIELRVLVRPKEAKLPQVKRLQKNTAINIVWGDLTDLNSLKAGIENADVVLHVGGLVSPMADYLPEAVVEAVNVQGAANIIAAIKQVADPERTRLIYIGTVAQTGSRNAPIHWGRTGDPIKISAFDHYAISKTKAESLVAESGLRYWVSLRQSGMAHFNLWKTFDPIMFHNVLNGVFEWSTANDSGHLMAAMCNDAIPDTLWRNFYNIGGGASSRITNRELFVKNMQAVGINDFRKVLKPHWFATQNFHGQWYADSDKLQELVPFREQSIHDFFTELPSHIPWYVKLAGRLMPGTIAKRMEKLAQGPHGSLRWFSDNDEARINAHFKSRQDWENIPRDWEQFEFAQPATEPQLLDHGYDESKDREQWTSDDLKRAAEFRGGRLVQVHSESPFQPVDWQCASGHRFSLSPNTILKGGHWCPTCSYHTDGYEQQAKVNPFFAQVWIQEAVSTEH